ncbi:hypothetical protein ABH899_005372 [Paenibacillus sp. RC84]
MENHNDTWKYFGTFNTNDGEMALELARSSKNELKNIFLQRKSFRF